MKYRAADAPITFKEIVMVMIKKNYKLAQRYEFYVLMAQIMSRSFAAI